MTYTWSIPTGQDITGTTKIKDTDNRIAATVDDLVEFVNSEGAHAGQGLLFDLATKNTAQIISGIKTHSAEIIANGGVTGALTGNASTATLAASATTLTGLTSTVGELNILDGVTATASELNILDGAVATAAEVSHLSGVTSNIQTQLNAVEETGGTATHGWTKFGNGTMIEWGIDTPTTADKANSVVYTNTFINVPSVVITPVFDPGAGTAPTLVWGILSNSITTLFTYGLAAKSSGSTTHAYKTYASIGWQAIGKWK